MRFVVPRLEKIVHLKSKIKKRVCALTRGTYLYLGQYIFKFPSLICFNEKR
jgi:hypothetical protein